MARSLHKGPFICRGVFKRVQSAKQNNVQTAKKPIRVYSRGSVILHSFIGLYFEIHNGNKFIKIYVTDNMIGHKFGEFALTRKIVKHSGKKAIQKTVRKTNR